ncbi:MAG TPA: AMP-binding protein, partial [Acidimicrobiales bacterium]
MQHSVGDVHEAIAAAMPEREALVFRDRRISWQELTLRTRRLANVLVTAGLGCHRERGETEPWESGQDHFAIYLHNGNEYLECMLGAFKARVAPFNVNYRYVAEELRYLLEDAGAKAIVFHSAFAPTLAEVLGSVAPMALLLQVP